MRAAPLAFPIMGRALETNIENEELARWLGHHWRRDFSLAPISEHRIQLELVPEAGLPLDLAGHLPDHPPADANRAASHVKDDGEVCEVLLGSRVGGAYLALAPGEAHVQAWGVTTRDGHGRQALLLAMHEAVRASGLLPLHCAAAVAPGEPGATVLVGPRGAGKSTTLVRLAQAGWSPLCEDFAWLDPNSLQLYGWDLEVRLLPDAVERLGPLPASPARAEDGRKSLLSYADLEARFGVPRVMTARLQRLVFLRRPPDLAAPLAPARLERASAVPALWQSIGLPLCSGTRTFVAEQIGELLRSVQTRSWSVGAEPLTALLEPRSA